MEPLDDPLDLDSALPRLLEIYREAPMLDGDAAILAGGVVLELESLTDHWDALVRRNVGAMLAEAPATEAVLAIARRHERLRPSDHALWADLREELLGRLHLRPLVALPAA